MADNSKDKVNIDIYFSDFEVVEGAPADSQSRSDAAQEWRVLPQSFATQAKLTSQHPSKKELNRTELEEASYELRQLRWQIEDDFSVSSAIEPVAISAPEKRRRPMLTTALIAGLFCTGFTTYRYCENFNACQQASHAAQKLGNRAIAQGKSWYRAVKTPPQEAIAWSSLAMLNAELPQPRALDITDPDFRAGLSEATRAADLTQTATRKEEWQKVIRHWEKAISHLTQVSQDSHFRAIAQTKINAYYDNLEYAYRELDSFREAANAAMQAAEMAQVASTRAEWQDVSQAWAEAIELMKEVTPESPHYYLAQYKIDEYTDYLVYAQSAALNATAPQPSGDTHQTDEVLSKS